MECKSVQWKARCSMRTHRHKTKLMAFEAIEWECRVDWFGAGYGSWVSIFLTSLCYHTEIIYLLFRKIIICTWLSNIGRHEVPKQPHLLVLFTRYVQFSVTYSTVECIWPAQYICLCSVCRLLCTVEREHKYREAVPVNVYAQACVRLSYYGPIYPKTFLRSFQSPTLWKIELML